MCWKKWSLSSVRFGYVALLQFNMPGNICKKEKLDDTRRIFSVNLYLFTFAIFLGHSFIVNLHPLLNLVSAEANHSVHRQIKV